MSQSTEPATISSTEVQTHFGAIIRRVVKGEEQLVVERGGLPVMVYPAAERLSGIDSRAERR